MLPDLAFIISIAELQYLEWSDLCKYVLALQASREHLLNEGAYLRVLHQQHLGLDKLDSKKEIA